MERRRAGRIQRTGYVAAGALLTAGFAALPQVSWRSSREVHTHMEAVATCIALVVGAMALVRFYSKKNNTFLFIGAGFIGTALLDGYHAVVTSVQLTGRLPSALEALEPWSWVASRLFLSVCVYLSWLAWRREERLGEQGRMGETAIYAGAGVLTVLTFLFFALIPLPPAMYPELFFHRPAEFVPGAFFLIATIGYLKKDRWRTDEFESWLVLALIVSFVCQAVYMSRSGAMFDGYFDVAHLLKIVSYALVLIGLLASMYRTFDSVAVQAEHLATANAGLQREVQDRKKAEARVAERANELARSNAELEQFAYVASHDLQEPLRKISSCCAALAEDYADKLDDDGRKWIGYAVDGADRMRRLVSDLLIYSRVAKKGKPPVAVSAENACRTAIEDLQEAIEECAADVTVHPLPRVLADETQLSQLFLNLIGNALKYRCDNVPCVEIGVDATQPHEDVANRDEFTLYVRDNGIGIEPEYFERIFVIFQRLHHKTEYSGTGIGLAICKKIVERHGGRLWVESTPGRGSTFFFTIPSAGATKNEPSHRQPTAAAH